MNVSNLRVIILAVLLLCITIYILYLVYFNRKLNAWKPYNKHRNGDIAKEINIIELEQKKLPFFFKIDFYAKTDIGLVRKANEDSYGISEMLNLFMIADGMGGYEHGKEASRTVVNAIRSFIEENQ